MKKAIMITIAILIMVPCLLASFGFVLGFVGAAIGCLISLLIELIGVMLESGWICFIIAIACGVFIFKELKGGP